MTTLAPTVYTHTFPGAAGWLRDLILILLGALLVALLAQVEIPLPFTPVPITGQTLGVLLVGAALGSKRGLSRLLRISQWAYLVCHSSRAARMDGTSSSVRQAAI